MQKTILKTTPMSNTQIQTEVAEQLSQDLLEQLVNEYQLIIYNDDVNTFDHVINCLVQYCRHEPLQAEQCALIIHTTGKCSVKVGTFQKLKPIAEVLLDQGLSAKVE